MLPSCTSTGSDTDVAELAGLDRPDEALAWLAGGDDASIEDRDVSARLLGLVEDSWSDDGGAAADVLVSALGDASDDEDRARLTAQLIHVLAHEDVAEDAVRQASATVLAGRAAELRDIAVGRTPSDEGVWTAPVRGTPAMVMSPDILGEPRTIRNLVASDAHVVMTDGEPTGAAMDLVLSRSFEEREDRLEVLSTAVQVASAAPIDATTDDLAAALGDADTVLVDDVSTVVHPLTINALLEAGFLDIEIDSDVGLPRETVVDGRLDPLLLDGDVSTSADPLGVDAVNSWFVSYAEPTAPYELIGDQATGAAQIDLTPRE